MIDPAVIIEIDGRRIPAITSFNLSVDILQDADTMTFGVSPSEYPNLALDGEIKMRFGVDGNVQFSGFAVTNEVPTTGFLPVQCWDRMRRLVTETVVPKAGFKFGSGSLLKEIERVVNPIFRNVVFSNAEDRNLRRQSRRGRSRTIREPLTRTQLKSIGKRVQAGTKRASALTTLLTPLGLLAWSSADGRTLIVAKPNYTQRPQYKFIHAPDESNVLEMSYKESIEGRYTEIILSGSAKGTGIMKPVRIPGVPTVPRTVMRSLGRAVDTTGDMRTPRTLFVRDTNAFPEEAQALAERMLGQQIGNARPIEITVAGYGQEVNGGLIFYAPDTLATVRRAIPDFKGQKTIEVVYASYYITSVEFSESQSAGPSTRLQLVPTGTPLV